MIGWVRGLGSTVTIALKKGNNNDKEDVAAKKRPRVDTRNPAPAKNAKTPSIIIGPLMRARKNQTNQIFTTGNNFTTRRFDVKCSTPKLIYLILSITLSLRVIEYLVWLFIYPALSSILVALYC